MKKLITLIALTLSVGAFAQETVYLTNSNVSVNSSSATLVRTASTPAKVEVTFQVPMANSYCAEPRTEYVRRTCHRTETIYQTRTVCRDVSTAPNSTPNGNTGPNYNPPSQTRRVCTEQRVNVGTRQIAYDCSYTNSYCARYGTDVQTESDKVKIKFDLPKLGGSEEETFVVSARQRAQDGSNVEYDINPTKEGQTVKKKGIFGYDSYVIEE
jgi:hypothetical protein